MTTILPFGNREKLSVLDLCCGPGDVGRTIQGRFPGARLDCVDRDSFLLSLCEALNKRPGIQFEVFVRDMWEQSWTDGLSRDYDVVATANALHWFDIHRVAELFKDVFLLLRPAGVFVFFEPASSEQRFAEGFRAWKAKQANPYDPQTWGRFWARANALVGYDHTTLLGSRDPRLIGDEGIPVSEWVRLLKSAGFQTVDVPFRNAEKLIIAAAKP